MATPRQVEIVAGLHQAFSERNPDAFVKHVTDDAVLRPSVLITGRGEYRGPEDVRVGFAEVAKLLEERGEDITIVPIRFYADAENGDWVMSHSELTLIRKDGERLTTEIAYLWEMRGEKLAGLSAWLSFDEGLEQLGEPQQVRPGS